LIDRLRDHRLDLGDDLVAVCAERLANDLEHVGALAYKSRRQSVPLNRLCAAL
jgi:hypothetical protein